jgi:AcrR family transcriptional regulator
VDLGSENLAGALWEAATAGRRGPKPRLSGHRIIDEAIALADTEGLDAVSMQRIGECLGVTKMALYRHIGGKAELLALMLDIAMGPPQIVEDPTKGWRAALTEWAQAAYHTFAKHPWALQIAVGPRVFGPNELAWTEHGLRTLTATALPPAERLDALALISGHVRALVQQSFDNAGRRITDTESRIRHTMASVITAHAQQYPAVAEALGPGAPADQIDNALNFGLARILDGIEAYHQQLCRSGPT